MRYLILAIFFTLIGISSLAQCVTNGITTNPDNPINNQWSAFRNIFFDWRAQTYSTNSTYNPPIIASPFYYVDNTNIANLYFSKDMRPEDGWELIKHDLGFKPNGTPVVAGYVYLVLYNKYSGILRILLAGDDPDSYNGARIRISFFSNSNSTASSILSNASRIFALDKFESDPAIESTSQYLNGVQNWFYADFPMSYDPCTCFYSSILSIQVKLIETADIQLEGSITGKIASITNPSEGQVKHNGFSVNNLTLAAQNASKTYNSINKFAEDQLKQAISETAYYQQMLLDPISDDLYGVPFNQLETAFSNNASPTEIQSYEKFKGEMGLFQNIFASSGLLRTGLKAAPYVAAALKFTNYFISGGKAPGPQQVQIQPLSINANLNLKGSIVTPKLYRDILFATPGSQDAANNSYPDTYPYYNEVLGIFNLLETVKIYSKNLEDYYFSNPNTGAWERRELNIYQVAPIRYVINPAAGFRTDNAEIIASLDFGDFQTAYLPLSALTSYSVKAGSASSYDQIYYNSTLGCTSSGPLVLRLLINLERINSDSNTQNVLIAVTYPIELVDGQSLNYNFSYCETYSNTGNNDAANNLTLQNQYVGSNVYAWNTISIGSNVTFIGNNEIKSNNVIIKSGGSISTNVTLKSGLLNGHIPFQVQPASPSEVQAFCGSGTYNSQNRLLRKGGLDNEKDSEKGSEAEESIGLLIYPNPAQLTVSLRYFLKEESIVNLSITDISGRVVDTIVDQYQLGGSTEINYDLSNLMPGVYICFLKTNQGTQTKKLIVSK